MMPEQRGHVLWGDIFKIKCPTSTKRVTVSQGINTLNMAKRLKITFYDAAYLNVAKELRKTLVTDDKELREIAKRVKMKTLSSEGFIQSSD